MSSHSGTIGRKRGGSGGSGGSEYYFNGGEHAIRRQRSAEWHSRHAYNSSSEDEYQNTGQTSAFDTQLLAQLLLQSQQLASKSFSLLVQYSFKSVSSILSSFSINIIKYVCGCYLNH